MSTAADLVDAVAGWIDRDVLPSTAGREAFQARVALNALRIVERELRDAGPDVDRASLARAVREGTLTPDDHESLLRDVLARIAVDSPTYPTRTEARALWPDLAEEDR